MVKFYLSCLSAVSIIALEATPATAVSEARVERGFSCTDMCTKDVKCDDFDKCAKECSGKGGLLSRIKGRQGDVIKALDAAKQKCYPLYMSQYNKARDEGNKAEADAVLAKISMLNSWNSAK